jgi:hypothetical protein
LILTLLPHQGTVPASLSDKLSIIVEGKALMLHLDLKREPLRLDLGRALSICRARAAHRRPLAGLGCDHPMPGTAVAGAERRDRHRHRSRCADGFILELWRECEDDREVWIGEFEKPGLHVRIRAALG